MKKKQITHNEKNENLLMKSQKQLPLYCYKRIQTEVSDNSLKSNSQHMTINVHDCHYIAVQNAALALEWAIEKTSNQFSHLSNCSQSEIIWRDSPPFNEQYWKIQQFQRINHFPLFKNYCRKDIMNKQIQKMQKIFKDDFQFQPQSWDLKTQKQQMFNEYFEKKKKLPKNKTLIIKPQAGCQGKGIFLTNNYSDIEKLEHFIAQKYISNPYLIDGLKFDLRIYIIVLQVHPNLILLVYEDGLARFCTEPYQLPAKNNRKNICMHLTNYAINKHSLHFIYENNEKNQIPKLDDPNLIQNLVTNNLNLENQQQSQPSKRKLSQILNIIEKKHGKAQRYVLWQEIKSIIIKYMLSILPILQQKYIYYFKNTGSCRCFQLLGVDILLDDQLKPWLLELNHMPSLKTDQVIDCSIKIPLIKGILKMTEMDQAKKENWKILLQTIQTQQELKKKFPQYKVNADDLIQKYQIQINQITKQDKIKIPQGFCLLYPGIYDNIQNLQRIIQKLQILNVVNSKVINKTILVKQQDKTININKLKNNDLIQQKEQDNMKSQSSSQQEKQNFNDYLYSKQQYLKKNSKKQILFKSKSMQIKGNQSLSSHLNFQNKNFDFFYKKFCHRANFNSKQIIFDTQGNEQLFEKNYCNDVLINKRQLNQIQKQKINIYQYLSLGKFDFTKINNPLRIQNKSSLNSTISSPFKQKLSLTKCKRKNQNNFEEQNKNIFDQLEDNQFFIFNKYQQKSQKPNFNIINIEFNQNSQIQQALTTHQFLNKALYVQKTNRNAYHQQLNISYIKDLLKMRKMTSAFNLHQIRAKSSQQLKRS